MATPAVTPEPAPPVEASAVVDEPIQQPESTPEPAQTDGGAATAEPPSADVDVSASPALDPTEEENLRWVLERFGGDSNVDVSSLPEPVRRVLLEHRELNNRAGGWRDEAEENRKFREMFERNLAQPPAPDPAAAPPRQVPDIVEQRIGQDIARDQEAMSWRTEYSSLGAQIQKAEQRAEELYKVDEFDGPSGKIVEIDREIQGIEVTLKNGPKYGLPLDEFQTASLERQRDKLVQERGRLMESYKTIVDRINKHGDRRQQLAQAFENRLKGYRERYSKVYEDTQRHTTEERQKQAEYNRTVREKATAYPAALKSVGIPSNDPERVKRLWERVVKPVLVWETDLNNPKGAYIPEGKLQERIEEILREHLELSGGVASPGSKTYADAKRADAGRGTMPASRASVGKADPADMEIKSLEDWEKSWKARFFGK